MSKVFNLFARLNNQIIRRLMPKLNKIKFAIILLVLTVTCERDDICAEGTETTPRMLVGFYDVSNQEEFKSVLRLTAYGEDLVLDENGQPSQPTSSSEATLVFNSNTTELSLPLRIGNEGEEITTRFILEKNTNLRLDEDPNTQSNEDIIEIKYKPQFVYVSRACGYKSIFTELEVLRVDDSDNWIIDILIDDTINATIENENSIHVQIFH
jgi:hypothetical protein